MEKQGIMELQLFADGGAGAGAAGGEGANGASGEFAAPEASRQKDLSQVQYGIQPTGGEPMQQAQGQGQAAAAKGTQETEPETFDSLIKGKYKKEFGDAVQGIVKERLKNSKQAETTLKSLTPMLQALAQKNGLDGFDASNAEMLKTLSDKVTNDDSLYEEEAMRRGMPVAVLKQLKTMEREQAARAEQDRQMQEEQQVQQHLYGLVQQAQQVAQLYPGFDLQNELNTNPEFLRLTSPEVGVDVQTAYEITHKGELFAQGMQAAVQKTKEKMANAVQSQQRRPQENGMGAARGIDTRADPSKWTDADFDEVRNRVKNGEKIYL